MTVINTNTSALNAQYNLGKVQGSMEKAMERLSSGVRINSAADDAAGLAISSRMDSQIRGLQMNIRNAGDGISLVQSAEGALQESTNILQRMYELSIQSSNSIYNDSDRAALQNEISQLQTELDRIASDTEFNGQKILDGSFVGKTLNVGFSSGGMIGVDIFDQSTSNIGSVGTKDAVATLTSTVSQVAMGVANEVFSASRSQDAQVFDNTQNISRSIIQHNIGTDESQNITKTTVSAMVAATTATADGFTAVAAGSTNFERANQVAGVDESQLISYNAAGSTAGADGIAEVTSWKVNGRIEHTDVLSMGIDGQTAITVTVGSEHFGATEYETKTNALNALVTKWNNNLTGDNVDAASGKVVLSLQMIDGDHYIVATASNPSDTALDIDSSGLTVTNTNTSMIAGDFSADDTTVAASGAAAYTSVTINNEGNIKVGDAYSFIVADGGTFTYTVVESDIGSTDAETLSQVRQSLIDGFNNSGLNFSEESGVLTASIDASNLDKITVTGTNTTAGADFDLNTSTVAVPKASNDTSLSVTQTTDATIVAGTAVGPLTTGKAADTASKELVIDMTNHEAGDTIQISFGGYTFSHTIDEGGSTDTATTVGDALVAEINDRLPELAGAGLISASNNAGTITLTAENAGAAGDFDVTVNTVNAEAIAIQGVIDFGSDVADAGTNVLAVGEKVTLSFGTNNSVTYVVTDEVAAMTTADADKAIVEAIVALGNESLQGVTLRVDPSVTGGNQIIYESTIPGVDPGFTAAAVGDAVASARVNSLEFSGYIGQGDAFTIADGAGNSITVTATSATQALDTNDERKTAIRNLALDALEADAGFSAAYTLEKDGEFGIKMTAKTVATDFELTVSSSNATLSKQAKIEDLTLSGHVNAGDVYSVDFGNGNVAEYIATNADANSSDALASVRDNLMAAISATGLVTVEARGSDTIRLTAGETGVDFRAVSSASNSVADSQIEEIAIANVEEGDAFSISINGEAVSYTAQSGDTAEDVAAWFADNADITGFTMSASGTNLTVSGGAGVSYNLHAQATNYAGGLQEETLSVSGTLDRGDTYNVSIDGESIATKVEQGDTKSDLLNRIAENVNSAAGDKVVATINDDGTLSIKSAQNGMAFNAKVEVVDIGRGANTVSAIDISTEAGAAAAGEVILGALSQINETRAQLGAIENRLDHTINNLGNIVVNSEASKSRIFDADFAQETVNLTKAQILSQAATSMLAQANQSKQTVLALLQG